MMLNPLIQFYESLTPQSIAQFSQHYSEDAYFKDPFNEVHNLPAIQRIFTHMFTQVDSPRFMVLEHFEKEKQIMLIWEFHFRGRQPGMRQDQVIRGVSHLKANAEGKICFHRDYWDASEELYMNIPGFGLLMRALRRTLSA